MSVGERAREEREEGVVRGEKRDGKPTVAAFGAKGEQKNLVQRCALGCLVKGVIRSRTTRGERNGTPLAVRTIRVGEQSAQAGARGGARGGVRHKALFLVLSCSRINTASGGPIRESGRQRRLGRAQGTGGVESRSRPSLDARAKLQTPTSACPVPLARGQVSAYLKKSPPETLTNTRLNRPQKRLSAS